MAADEMIGSLVDELPSEWKCDVQVSQIGKDPKGNVVTTPVTVLEGVAPAWQSSSDPTDFATRDASKAAIYAGQIDTNLVRNGYVVDIPDGPWPSGRWRVDGTPNRWPLGTEILLARE